MNVLRNTTRLLKLLPPGKRILNGEISSCLQYSVKSEKPVALRSRKAKSVRNDLEQYFEDVHVVEAAGGKGGNGCISFLQTFSNEKAGPDGGDGGTGGHVIFQASSNVSDLRTLQPRIKAEDGERGYNRDCFGKNAKHTIVPVPIGTIIKNQNNVIVCDLDKEGMMFLAARGGAGGHGNHYFTSDTLQAPQIAELGADGEVRRYRLEVKTMAHIGLLGMPNAGKSTLLRAISRAKPEVADYAFTTLKPQIGMVQYSDYEQVAVADLPGLVEGSHKNLGLGIQFLKHVERCIGLFYIIDLSEKEPWTQYEKLRRELSLFNEELQTRPQAVIANKMDLPQAQDNLEGLKSRLNVPVIPISAKMGTNLSALLDHMREIYDETKKNEDDEESSDYSSEIPS